MKHRNVSSLLSRAAIVGYVASVSMVFVSEVASAQAFSRGSRPEQPPRSPSSHSSFPPFLPFPHYDPGPPPDDSGAQPASSPLPTSDVLLEKGPQFPVTLTVGAFDVVGFARGGWPFVIDFEPRPDSCTWIQMSSDNAAPWSAILDADGRIGRHVVKLAMPDSVAKEPHAAHYVVYSVMKPCVATQATRDYSPIDVYGIGAGPRAVGSVAINHLKFGPSAPDFSREVALFGYVADNEFGRITQEILDYRQRGIGQWSVIRVRTTEIVASLKGPHSGSWDGTGQSGNRRPGIYRLQVRAWNTLNDERSWVGAISPDSVHISSP